MQVLKQISLHLAGAASLVASLVGQQPLDTQLLQNGGFESGDLTGWSEVSGSAAVNTYGAGGTMPVFDVALAVQGGFFLVEDVSGNAVLEQRIDVSQNAGPLQVFASGDFGGFNTDADSSELQIEFLDAGGGSLGIESLGGYSNRNRNRETVVIRDDRLFDLPPSTAELVVSLKMIFTAGQAADGLADNLVVELRSPQGALAPELGTELLVNGDFEAGWTPGSPLQLAPSGGWIGSPLNANVHRVESFAWGSSAVPAFGVGAAIDGGIFCLGDGFGGNAAVRQTVDVSSYSAEFLVGGIDLHMEGAFGGRALDNDVAFFRVVFISALGAEIGRFDIGSDVTRPRRNRETIVMKRSARVRIPPGTAELALEAGFLFIQGPVPDGTLDNVSARLQAVTPFPAQPLGEQLLVNGDFESGWSPMSPLTPEFEQGWTQLVAGDNAAERVPYGSGLSLQQRDAVGGGARYLRDLGSAGLEQAVDLRGNVDAINGSGLTFQFGGYVGGQSQDGDSSFLSVAAVRFQNGQRVVLGEWESTRVSLSAPRLLYRCVEGPIPTGTEFLEAKVFFEFFSGPIPDGAADNLRLEILDGAVPSAPITYSQNLVSNPGFEDGASGFGPDGWRLTVGNGDAVAYGTGFLPDALAAVAWGGGTSAASFSDTGDTGLQLVFEQAFDVSGNRADIDQGLVDASLEAFLGGVGTSQDHAIVTLDFFDDSEPPLLLARHVIGPVTAADRNNQTTLLRRKTTVDVSPLTRRAVVCLTGSNFGGGSNNALADNVSLSLIAQQLQSMYPGSSEDVNLLSGINGAAASGGPGADVKQAAGGDFVTLRIVSPNSGFDFAPLMLLAQPFATGLPPVGTLPGLATDLSQTVILFNGAGPGVGTAPLQLVLPLGTEFVVPTPAGFPVGASVMFQALVLPTFAPPQFSPLPAANGLFASTPGHEIRF